jgi:hypothetical protein
MNRRRFLLSALAAPVIVRASSLMAVVPVLPGFTSPVGVRVRVPLLIDDVTVTGATFFGTATGRLYFNGGGVWLPVA